jgi:hypothetical protein
MNHVDPGFPVFVLIGLVAGESYYAKTIAPRVKLFKTEHLGSPAVILHSRDIRRCEGPIEFLRESPLRKQSLYAGINDLFGLRVRLFAVVVDKVRLQMQMVAKVNPYHLSLSILLSLVIGPPGMPGPSRTRLTQIIAESRGRREDRELQHEFQLLRRSGLSSYGATDVQDRRATTLKRLFPERVEFVRKIKGVAGLELADLAAYPIARAAVNRDWTNPAFQSLAPVLKNMVFFPNFP